MLFGTYKFIVLLMMLVLPATWAIIFGGEEGRAVVFQYAVTMVIGVALFVLFIHTGMWLLDAI